MNSDKTKHAPSPWKYTNKITTPYNGKQYLEDSNGRAVADIHILGESVEQAKANASLIAAAPELLAALIEIDSFLDEAPTVRAIGLSAIAKARGQA